MKELILGTWLAVEAYFDFKYKEIPLWLSLVGSVIGLLFCVQEERAIGQMILAFIPGIIALGFSWVTKELMGYGDGIILFILGCYMSFARVLSIGMLAFGLAGIVALILLVVFHKKGSYRMPFIPFLGVAYWSEYIISLGKI